jgi:hypothetical protein
MRNSKSRKHRFVKGLVLLTSLMVYGPASAFSEDFNLYAPPQVAGWSSWYTVASHVGRMSYSIDCNPSGDTQIYGQVRYWKTQDKQVVEDFIESTSITTASAVANVEVRLKGNPLGSQVRVSVDH